MRLHKARNAKNDEFYTQFEDVSKELQHYKSHFKNKIVLCNCDNPTQSAFWKYFHLNFSALGLRKLISTHYDKDKPTYKMEYTGGNDSDIAIGVKTALEGNGDFRSKECLDILDEVDIVVTNPPFSLFREYVAVLMEHRKRFVIWGNNNAITYKEFFPLLKNNKVWLGYIANQTCVFRLSDDYAKWDEKITSQMNDGHKYGKCPAISVFTNLDIKKRHEKLTLWKHYTPEEYPRYDNYDAINVDKVADIPCDYDGVMGVPITFLDKFNPEQFEIVAFRKGQDGKDLTFTREREREREFNRTFASLFDFDCRDDKKRRRQNQWKAYLCKNNYQAKIEPIDLFFPMSMVVKKQLENKNKAPQSQ